MSVNRILADAIAAGQQNQGAPFNVRQSGIVSVNVINPTAASVPQPLQVSGIVGVQQPLQTIPSGILPVELVGGIIPSGIQPVFITSPISVSASVSIPQPLQISGIVGVSPLPLPVSGATPQLVVPTLIPSGIQPVAVVTPITTTVNIPQPLQVSGIVGISPLPIPASGVTPQLVVPTVIGSGIQPVSVVNPVAVTIPQPLQVSGIVAIAPLPLPVSGVTPQLVVPSGIIPVAVISQPPTTVTIPQPLQVSGIVAISPLPLPVSGVTAQLVTPTVIGSGIAPVSIVAGELVTTIPQPLQVSGIVGITPLPVPVSGIVGISPLPVPVSGVLPQQVYPSGIFNVSIAQPIQISGIVGISPLPVPSSGVTPQLVVPTVVPSGIQPVSFTTPIAVSIPQPLQISGIVGISPLPLPVSGATPQLVVPTVIPSGIQPVNVVASIPQVVTIPTPLQVSGIVGISPLPVPVSGVIAQAVYPSGIFNVSITQPLQVSGIVGISPVPLSVLPSGIQSVNVINPQLPVSGIVGLVQPISVVPSGIIPVFETRLPVPVSGVIAQAVYPSGIFNVSISQPIQVSGIIGVSPIPLPVSGATPQLVVPTVIGSGIQPVNVINPVNVVIPQPLQVSGIVGLSPSPLPVSGIVGISPNPLPVSSLQLPAALGRQSNNASLSVVQGTPILTVPVSGISQSQIGLADDLGNAYQPFVPGAAGAFAPADGVWTVNYQAATTGGSGVIVKDGISRGHFLGTTPTVSGVIYSFKMAVNRNSMYKPGGVITDGWIGPA